MKISKNIFIFFTLTLICIMQSVTGQTNKIIIKGVIDKAITKLYLCNQLTIMVNKTSNSRSVGMRFHIDIDSNGFFNTELSFEEPIVYLSFEFEDKKEVSHMGLFRPASFPLRRSMKEAYLFQNGDSIFADIRKDGRILFSGVGSEKLICQSLIYNIDPISYSVYSRLSDLKEVEQKLPLIVSSFDMSIKLRQEILKSYKPQLSEIIYNLLYLDANASAEYPFLELIAGKPYNDSEIVRQYYQSYFFKKYKSESKFKNMSESIYYADMLFLREYTLFFLQTKKTTSKNAFKVIYERIKTKYTGKLKDKLVFICFERFINRYRSEIKSTLVNALSIMQDSTYKKMLSDLLEKHSNAFPFNKLYDDNNREYKLNDFRGKVLIIDFWFTGCGGCISLAKEMNEIYQKYRHNNEIVFITVCTDSKETWLKSVKSGLYTSNGMINLHTNGLGFKHPLITHYNYNAFPQQLIIDKTGKLITPAPSSPLNDSNRSEFLQLIKNNISK